MRPSEGLPRTRQPDLRRHLVGLLSVVIDLSAFQRWFWTNSTTIDHQGSDENVHLLLLVLNRLSEYTSASIDASERFDALHTDSLVQKELTARSRGSYGM
jgi:hypothetical protein